MSYAQLTKLEEQDYFNSKYQQNNVAEFLLANATLSKIVAPPPYPNAFAVATAVNDGTYRSPATISLQRISGNLPSVSQAATLTKVIVQNFPINTETLITNMGIEKTTGLTVDFANGRILQTYAQNRNYFAVAAFSYVNPSPTPLTGFNVSLFLYNADTTLSALIATQSHVLTPLGVGVPAFTGGVTVSGFFKGLPNPNSYVYLSVNSSGSNINTLVDVRLSLMVI